MAADSIAPGVIHKAAITTQSHIDPVTGPEGLRIRIASDEVAAEYHDPEPRESDAAIGPFKSLSDWEGGTGGHGGGTDRFRGLVMYAGV